MTSFLAEDGFCTRAGSGNCLLFVLLDLEDFKDPLKLVEIPETVIEYNSQRPWVSHTYWVDRAKPRLTFFLACIVLYFDNLRCYISQVQLNKHDLNTKFTTQTVTTFTVSLDCWRLFSCFALNNRYLLVTQDFDYSYFAVIRIIDISTVFDSQDYPNVDSSLPFECSVNWVCRLS